MWSVDKQTHHAEKTGVSLGGVDTTVSSVDNVSHKTGEEPMQPKGCIHITESRVFDWGALLNEHTAGLATALKPNSRGMPLACL